MTRRLSAPFLGLAALLALAACAGSTRPAGEPIATTIQVDNDLSDLVTVNVYLISDSGRRDPLGNVAPGDVVTFRFNGDIGNYVLQAIRTDGRAGRRSNPFRMVRGTTVRWRLNSNSVVVSRR